MIIEYFVSTNDNKRGGHYLLLCDTCGKQFERNAFGVKNKTNHYCNKDCFHKAEIGRSINDKQRECLKLGHGSGEENSRWIGGRINHAGGYIYIHKPEHPMSGKRGYVLEHRLVMEDFIGRYLKPEEVIHHVNKNRSDNRIENLMLFNNKREHLDYHKTISILKDSK